MNDIRAEMRAFYDAEALAESRRAASGFRVELCADFVDALVANVTSAVIDVGAGPGTDADMFTGAGVGYVGVDLAPENAKLAARRHRRVVPASLFELPFADGSFDAAWSMSTLMHVPEMEVDAAMRELTRVLRPGAPIGIGVWGGVLGDIMSDRDGAYEHRRLFSLRSAATNRRLLEAHGTVERFERRETGPDGWEYHFAVLRIGS